MFAGCFVVGTSGAIILAKGPITVRTAVDASDDLIAPQAPVLTDSPTILPMVLPLVPPPETDPPVIPQRISGTVTVDGKSDAGDRPDAGTAVNLAAGTYRITQESGCTRLGRSSTHRWTGKDLRVSYANRDALGTPVTIAWPDRKESKTERDCTKRLPGATQTIHHAGGPVAFWIADETAKDNSGSIELQYASASNLVDVRTRFSCSEESVRVGDVVVVRGKTIPALVRTPIPIALPTGGAAPERFFALTDTDGAFELSIPVTERPTDNLTITPLWPIPSDAITEPSASCVLPITGNVPGLRAATRWFDRMGTPKKPVYVPDDPYASTRVRVNYREVAAARISITRLEYDENPAPAASRWRSVRFLRVVSDIDPTLVASGSVRFTLTPAELRAAKARTSAFLIAQYFPSQETWRPLPTANLSAGGRGIFEATATRSADLRDGTFALVVKP